MKINTKLITLSTFKGNKIDQLTFGVKCSATKICFGHALKSIAIKILPLTMYRNRLFHKSPTNAFLKMLNP